MRLTPGWKRVAAALLVAATAFYLAYTITHNWQQVRAFRWDVDPLRLAASLVAHVAVLAWGVWVWGQVQRRFEHAPVGFGTLLRIWFLSSLSRYIPGKVFQFFAVAQLAGAAGLSGKVLLTSLVVHTGMALLSAVVLSAWTLSGALLPALPAVPVGIATTLVALLLVHPRFLNAALGVIPRLLKRETIRWNGSWGHGAALLALSVLSWAFYGGAYYLLLSALTEVPAGSLTLLAGVNALSFVAGYLSLVAPAGAGVREAAMTQLLLPLVPASVGAVLAVASRLWTIAAELAGGALVLALARRGPAPGVDAASGAAGTGVR
ncbi:MAG TPA: lysylphosphatidylglycerol synthase domain-containing protein [Longimicrobiaceae bacterium]|nr:lysylphosphatidylglycerol synthase domain-containing protein [Longimicrobiaceae bacterium]